MTSAKTSSKQSTCEKKMEYRCAPCNQGLANFKLLSSHLTRKHEWPGRYQCNTCLQQHRAMDLLQKHLEENVTHMRTREAERRNRSDKKPAPENETAKQEQQQHQEESPEQETSKQRRKRLERIRQTRGKHCPSDVLEQAEAGTSDGKLVGKWICRSCSSTFPNIVPLTKHLWSHASHSERSGTRGSCQTCNQRFRGFKQFRAHFLQNPTHMRILVRGALNSEHLEMDANLDEIGETITDGLGARDESTESDDMEVDSEGEGEPEEDIDRDVNRCGRESIAVVSCADEGMKVERTPKTWTWARSKHSQTDSDSDSDPGSNSDSDSDSSSSSVSESESDAASIDDQADEPSNRIVQPNPDSRDKWYPGKLARASPPKVIIADSSNDATTFSPPVEAAPIATATPANPRFPRLQPVNVPLHVPVPPPQTAMQTREDRQQLGTMIAATSANQKQRDISFSDNCGSETESESEEDLIDLGENTDIKEEDHDMDAVAAEQFPGSKATFNARPPGNVQQDSESEATSEDDSSEDDVDLDSRAEPAFDKPELHPASIGTAPVSPRSDIQERRDRLSGARTTPAEPTAAGDIKVKVEDHYDDTQCTPPSSVDFVNTHAKDSATALVTGASVKAEPGPKVSDKTNRVLHGSRDRVASFLWHYACSHCDRTFSTPDALLAHIRDMDKNTRWFTCSSCNRGFATAEPFKAHLAEFSTHMRVGAESDVESSHGMEKRPERQPRPSAPLYSSGNSTRRRKSYCSTCDQTYKSIDHLIKHRRRYHKSAPFKCMTCSKDFPAGVNLKYHLLEHLDHMQVVLEAVVPETVAASSIPATVPTHPRGTGQGTASGVIELSSDSDSDAEPALELKTRQTMTLGGEAKIRVSKRRLPEDASSEAPASKNRKVSRS